MVLIDPPNSFGVVYHFILIYGIEGDGTLDNTSVRIIDPADGTLRSASFRTFKERLDLARSNDSRLNVGERQPIMHW